MQAAGHFHEGKCLANVSSKLWAIQSTGGDTKLAEELTSKGGKTEQYAGKTAETTTTSTSKKTESHYVS